jgi:histidinol-phosphate aminotransferase
MSRFWSPIVHRLSPYTPGEQPKLENLVKLNTNENPYGPSPRVIEAIRGELGDGLRLYPDPGAALLCQAAADYYGLKPQQVFAGNGSDEVLAHTFCALFQQDRPLLFPDITYSFYPVYCQLYGIDYETVPLAGDLGLQLDDYMRPNGGIIFPNPNAPTGCLLPLDDIERLLRTNTDSVVVVDEAYIDFGGESAVSLINRYPNLLVIQTLSKSRALAGMRIGLALGDAELIAGLERVKDSFNSYPLDRLAIVAAVAALEDRDYFRESCQRVIASREQLAQDLHNLGFEVLPSSANFVFVRHPQHDAAELAAALREQGVIVRHFRQQRIDQYLRITVGTPEQNAVLLRVLGQLI